MKRADLGIGFTKENFLRFAGKFAAEAGVPFKGSDASEKWWRGLKSRHADFSLRSPEATSSGRHAAMTRERLCKYFAALKGVLEENSLAKYPERIWNMDETGLSLSHKPAKVMAKKGTRAVQSKVSLSRELITVIACGNVRGDCIPPHVILPGKSERVMKGYDIDCAPLGTNLSVSDSGWTKKGIGRLWFTTTFLPNIGPERPQLLTFDGHGSHNHIEFVENAREENIILIELPSKTSHWTQPFDRTVFNALKSKWNSHIQTFMSETGVSVGHAQFFRMLRKAWSDSLTVENISSGFVSTGICPYNPGVIPNMAYTPSELYVDESVATSSSTPCPSPASVQSASSCTATAVMPSCSMSVLPSRDSSPAILPSLSSVTPTPLSSPNMSIIPDCSLSSPVGSSEVPVVSSTSSQVHVLPIMQQPTSALPATVLSFDVMISDENVIDLPVKVDSNGNLCMVSETPAPEDEIESFSPEVVECSSDMALKAIESALTGEMKKKYEEAFQQGKDVNDSLFHTWKMYFEKRTTPAVASSLPSTSSSTLFSLPMQTKKSAAKRKQIGQYFVISSDEAYQEMKKQRKRKS